MSNEIANLVVGYKKKKKVNLKKQSIELLCFRMLLHPWLMPRLGAMLMMWVSFFLHYRLVYTEGDTAVLLHTKWQNHKNLPMVGKKEAFRGLGIAIHAVVHHFSNSKKRKKKITFFILYLRYFVLCILILWVFNFWRFRSLIAGCRSFCGWSRKLLDMNKNCFRATIKSAISCKWIIYAEY